MFCKVVFDVPLDRDFDYHVPPELEAQVCPGVRITAPFGPRLTAGIVLSVSNEPTYQDTQKIKDIVCVVDPRPIFGNDLFPLAQFMKKTWGGAIGQILFALVPPQPYFKLLESPAFTPFTPAFAHTLLPHQQAALNTLQAMPAYEFHPVLLSGPAGTGKTETALRLAAQVLQNFGQTLITVPDIVAAKDFIARAQSAFGAENVFCWTSKMLLSQKKKYFSAVANGVPCVVISTRSGALLPFKNLRLAVVLQEENDNYKQEENKPYYHLRDLILLRGKTHAATVLFVSGTPSLEMLKRVKEQAVQEIKFTQKLPAFNFAPQVKITPKKGAKSKYLSDFLLEEIKQNLTRKEPVLLVLNRRGYSNAYYCLNCGAYARCKQCGSLLSRENTPEGGDFLLCKKCGAKEDLHQICPKCQNRIFKSRGGGTQKIVSEVQKLFPAARLLRLDSDTLKTKSGQGHLASAALKTGQVDILIGTRLAVSAVEANAVTLFGVLDADLELDSPDFRASEKLGQMLFYLRSRAACVPNGRLIVQASGTDIYPFEFLQSGDFAKAAEQELALREAFNYPPFIRLVRATLKNKDPKELCAQAAHLKSIFKQRAQEILGPVPCGKKTDTLKKEYLLFKLTDEQYFPAVEVLDSLSTQNKKQPLKLSADPYDFY